MFKLEEQIQKDEQRLIARWWTMGVRRADRLTLKQLLEVDADTIPVGANDIHKQAYWTAGFMAGCLARLQVYYATEKQGVKP